MNNYDVLVKNIRKLIPQVACALQIPPTPEVKSAEASTSENTASPVTPRAKAQMFDTRYLERVGLMYNIEDGDLG